MAESQPQRNIGETAQLTMLVIERGYGIYTVQEAVPNQQSGGEYIVTIFSGDNEAIHTLRGSVGDLRGQIEALQSGSKRPAGRVAEVGEGGQWTRWSKRNFYGIA